MHRIHLAFRTEEKEEIKKMKLVLTLRVQGGAQAVRPPGAKGQVHGAEECSSAEACAGQEGQPETRGAVARGVFLGAAIGAAAAAAGHGMDVRLVVVHPAGQQHAKEVGAQRRGKAHKVVDGTVVSLGREEREGGG